MVERETPVVERIADAGIVAGAVGTAVGLATKAFNLLHASLGLLVGAFIGKQLIKPHST